MNERKQQLLARLDEIGQALARTPGALALLALGSVGAELERLDEYSDLDFFVLTQPGYKNNLLSSLDWLNAVCPIAYSFRNTPDGYKVFFADGIFCELAIFEPAELRGIPFAAGRVVWQAPGFEPSWVVPTHTAPPEPKADDWLIGEVLTNLYVGLTRCRRGEKLSAARFIQGYAVDRLVELSSRLMAPTAVRADLFTGERRYEHRFPQLAHRLSDFMQGYDRSPESARAILAFLSAHFDVNPAMRQAILDLAAPAESPLPT